MSGQLGVDEYRRKAETQQNEKTGQNHNKIGCTADESADSSPIAKLGEAINPVALWFDIVYLCDDDLNGDAGSHLMGNLNSITVSFAMLYLISKSRLG